MKRQSKRNAGVDLAKADATQVFRRWLAVRILGSPGKESGSRPGDEKDCEDAPVPPEKDPPKDFPDEAWAVLSWLAEQGPEKLAEELTRVVRILLDDIEELTILLPHLRGRFPDRFKEAGPFFKGLDEALADMADLVDRIAGFRALQSEDSQLVMRTAFHLAGDPKNAEYFMRRYFALEPEEETPDQMEEGLIARLIQNAVQGVEVLERIERQYPETVAREAQYVDRWPVLRRCSDGAVKKSPAGKTLGACYTLASEEIVHAAGKKSLRVYLKPLVAWMARYSFEGGTLEERRANAESALKRRGIPFCLPFGPCPEEAVKVLMEATGIPPLRKDTARVWAEKLVVPFIMATDAVDLDQLRDPALQGIRDQRGVKSRKSFQSRLLDAVRKELPRMARK